MEPFLHKIAQHIVDRFGHDFSGLCIVLPNRRGGLYLKKALAEVAGRSVWAPEIYALEDFAARIAGRRLIENTALLFEMYEVHREVAGKNARPLDEILSWAPQLLHDFNDIDSYLVDPGALFGHLSEARAISLWNLDQRPLTDFQKNYLGFYRSLERYYTLLTGRLDTSRLGYPGLILRRTAETVQDPGFSLPWKHLLFAGFNALTKAEEIIFSTLHASVGAEILWDADSYYLDDPDQEAGDFLRRWRRKWGEKGFNWTGDHIASSAATITVTGIPGNIGQARYCGELLADMEKNGLKAEETAVVLMDEQLLVPLLNSIPPNIRDLNITMGLPLKNSSYYSLFEALLRMHENTERFRRAREGGKVRFYIRDVMKVLLHPDLQRLIAPGTTGSGIKHAIDGATFLSTEEITGLVPGRWDQHPSLPGILFGDYSLPGNAIASLKSMIVLLRDELIREKKSRIKEGETPSDIRMEFLFAFSNVLHQLETVMNRYGTLKTLGILHKLFRQIAGSTTLPFYGEPLRGLQVMGMLETRTLDFRNLILLSVNEDLIPGSKTVHSFIPLDIRNSFRLPVYHHKNSVYAYHFYRLLQRAETVNILHNTEPGELGGGEKSRFIKQLLEELPAKNPRVRIKEQLLSVPLLPAGDFLPIRVEKTPDVMKLLIEKTASGLAPSSLNSFRRCPLKFYFTFVAGFEEPKEMEETIDSQTLGQSVHQVLQWFYEPFVDSAPGTDDIEKMFPLIPELTQKSFRKHFGGSDLNYGKNLLQVSIAEFMVRNFLREEKRNLERYRSGSLPWKICLLEKKINSTVTVEGPAGETAVVLKGFVDRIDQLGNGTRIIDYKTGAVDRNELKLKEWDQFRTDPARDKAFQLMMYAWLYDREKKGPAGSMEAGIVSLRRISSGFMPVVLPGDDGNEEKINSSSLTRFETILVDLLKEILDPAIPFSQAEDVNSCRNCPWVTLCRR